MLKIKIYEPPKTREEFLKRRDEDKKEEREWREERRRIRCPGYDVIKRTRYKENSDGLQQLSKTPPSSEVAE